VDVVDVTVLPLTFANEQIFLLMFFLSAPFTDEIIIVIYKAIYKREK